MFTMESNRTNHRVPFRSHDPAIQKSSRHRIEHNFDAPTFGQVYRPPVSTTGSFDPSPKGVGSVQPTIALKSSIITSKSDTDRVRPTKSGHQNQFQPPNRPNKSFGLGASNGDEDDSKQRIQPGNVDWNAFKKSNSSQKSKSMTRSTNRDAPEITVDRNLYQSAFTKPVPPPPPPKIKLDRNGSNTAIPSAANVSTGDVVKTCRPIEPIQHPGGPVPYLPTQDANANTSSIYLQLSDQSHSPITQTAPSNARVDPSLVVASQSRRDLQYPDQLFPPNYSTPAPQPPAPPVALPSVWLPFGQGVGCPPAPVVQIPSVQPPPPALYNYTVPIASQPNQPTYLIATSQGQQQYYQPVDSTSIIQHGLQSAGSILAPQYYQPPQIAIVATDPATLRALLSGGLAPAAFMQSLMAPEQGVGQMAGPATMPSKAVDPQSSPNPIPPPPAAQTSQQQDGNPVSIQKPSPINSATPDSRVNKQPTRPSKNQVQLPIPQTTSNGQQLTASQISNQAKVGANTTTTKDNRPLSKASAKTITNQSQNALGPKLQDNRSSSNLCLLDTTFINNNRSPEPPPPPTIGHPPRTLKNLPLTESLSSSNLATSASSSSTAADKTVKADPTVRQPRKLDAAALLEKMQATVDDECQPPEPPPPSQQLLQVPTDEAREPSPISAYLAKMRQQGGDPQRPRRRTRSPRPLSVIDTQRSRPPDPKGQVNGVDNNDKSLVTVAQRAKSWLTNNLRAEQCKGDVNRHSTCGFFIDQDLVDCQDIVPVEDRVKLFDGSIRNGQAQVPSLEGNDRVIVNKGSVKSRAAEWLDVCSQELQYGSLKQPKLPSEVGNGGSVKMRPRNQLQGAKIGSRRFSNETQLISVDELTNTNKHETTHGDGLTKMSVNEKCRLFNASLQNPHQQPSLQARRKTQPVTLDDLARANQLILARLDGGIIESPTSTLKFSDFSWLPDDMSELSTPEPSQSTPLTSPSTGQRKLVEIDPKDVKQTMPMQPIYRPVGSSSKKPNQNVPEKNEVQKPRIPAKPSPKSKPVKTSPDLMKGNTVRLHDIAGSRFDEFFADPLESPPLSPPSSQQHQSNFDHQLDQLATSPVKEELDDDVFARAIQLRRSARPANRQQRRRPRSALINFADVKYEYTETMVSNVAVGKKSTESIRGLLRPTNAADKIIQDVQLRNSQLHDHALRGLASRADLGQAAANLRQIDDSSMAPLTDFQRQLLPYKLTPMLIQVKGRRHIQVRLVRPHVKSLNSGDCFLLVTRDQVWVWLGQGANVVENNKARELASWICQYHELDFRGGKKNSSSSSDAYITIQDGSRDYGKQKQAVLAFWQALGAEGPPEKVGDCGPGEEDERFERLIQHATRVYEVTSDQLMPCKAYWGSPLKFEMLTNGKGYVFDFGSELYLWTGNQLSQELRSAAIDLVQQAYNYSFDFSPCLLNPLDPLSTDPSTPVTGIKRPDWTLVGKLSQRGETILFKEKFSDWPAFGAKFDNGDHQPSGKKLIHQQQGRVRSIKPCPANSLYKEAFDELPPGPQLLTLLGRFVGRGGRGCRLDDGITRRYRVETVNVRVWAVSDFASNLLPKASCGQFHTGDTYIVGWTFKVFNVGQRQIVSIQVETEELNAYFFWHGSQSKITQQGAAALHTVELDTERGPQIRVAQGEESPAFCRLFQGRMIVHLDNRSSDQSSQRIRFFLIRGELALESHLIEVPAKVASLRSRGVFLLLLNPSSPRDPSTTSWLWFGQDSNEASRECGRFIVKSFGEKCPKELGTSFPNPIEFTQSKAALLPDQLKPALDDVESTEIVTSLRGPVGQDHIGLVCWKLHVDYDEPNQLQATRLAYRLQPDRPSVLAESSADDNSSSRTSSNSSDDQPLNMAQALAKRLHDSYQGVLDQMDQRSPITPCFPTSLSELYSATQPALFLLVEDRRAVYLWQGWWPTKASSYSSGSSDNDGEDRQPSSPTSSGIAAGSFTNHMFTTTRLAALKTVKSLAELIGVKAELVYAGLEPARFLALFPPCERNRDAADYHINQEFKVDGQVDSIESLIHSTSQSRTRPLSELQQRPADLDSTRLEDYVSDEEFQKCFNMTRQEFNELPTWKKRNVKIKVGLF